MRVDGRVDLGDHRPDESFGWAKAAAKAELGEELAVVATLQTKLYAEGASALLEGTAIVKLFLNVSADEQRRRLQDRADDPARRWKFRFGDLEERARWDDYQLAFRDAVRETSTVDAPWFVVPADRKWVRNLAVARILRVALERLDPAYPEADPAIASVTVT